MSHCPSYCPSCIAGLSCEAGGFDADTLTAAGKSYADSEGYSSDAYFADADAQGRFQAGVDQSGGTNPEDAALSAYEKIAENGFSKEAVTEIAGQAGAIAGAAVCTAYGGAAVAPLCGVVAGALAEWTTGITIDIGEGIVDWFSDDYDAEREREQRRKDLANFFTSLNDSHDAQNTFYDLLDIAMDDLIKLSYPLQVDPIYYNRAQVSWLLYEASPPDLKSRWVERPAMSGYGDDGEMMWLPAKTMPVQRENDLRNQGARFDETALNREIAAEYIDLVGDLAIAAEGAAAMMIGRAAEFVAMQAIADAAEQARIERDIIAPIADKQFQAECRGVFQHWGTATPGCDPYILDLISQQNAPGVPVVQPEQKAWSASIGRSVGAGLITTALVAGIRSIAA